MRASKQAKGATEKNRSVIRWKRERESKPGSVRFHIIVEFSPLLYYIDIWRRINRTAKKMELKVAKSHNLFHTSEKNVL